MGFYLRWGVHIWQFCVGLGTGYRGLGVFLGWLLTFIWLMEWICIHQHCNLCRILGLYLWLLSLFLEFCLMLFIFVVLIEYLIFPLEVLVYLMFQIFGVCCYNCCFFLILSSQDLAVYHVFVCGVGVLILIPFPLLFWFCDMFTTKAKRFLGCKGCWNKVKSFL